MKSLGLNPAEQETIDMTNEVGNNGLVYFPDFCKIVLRKYREDDKELLNQALFKVIPYDEELIITNELKVLGLSIGHFLLGLPRIHFISMQIFLGSMLSTALTSSAPAPQSLIFTLHPPGIVV